MRVDALLGERMQVTCHTIQCQAGIMRLSSHVHAARSSGIGSLSLVVST